MIEVKTERRTKRKTKVLISLCILPVLVVMGCSPQEAAQSEPQLEEKVTQEAAQQTQAENGAQPNIIFVLTDDQRYDALGVLDPNLETPNMDKMVKEGVHFRNAFVTTSLCSPSRATILTGQYMHNHGVVDNNEADTSHLEYFPQRLQQAGYKTALIGKWHMGGGDDSPRPGFDRWVSFKGQGHYRPTGPNGYQAMLNVDGDAVPQKGYITDELTDYAVDWLDEVGTEQPFMLYLSHKAVHAEFYPAERHQDQYADALPTLPDNAADTPEHRKGKPRWVHDQRNSWHGIDFPYHSELDVREYRREYNRSLSAVDDSLGRIFGWLEENNLFENTIVILMGDNGFMFGEHGLIDKRNAYEESMRVPLVMYAPGQFEGGMEITEVVANLDIAPTMLDWAGLEKPAHYEGESLVPLIGKGADPNWRDTIVYEYFWEYNFPHTPTTFAIRTPQYKLIQYHGVWETEELYDIVNDPQEMYNLIDEPEMIDVKIELRKALFEGVQNGEGENVIHYTERKSSGAVFRHEDRSTAAEFPKHWLRPDNAPDRTQMFRDDSRAKQEQMGTLTQPKPAAE